MASEHDSETSELPAQAERARGAAAVEAVRGAAQAESARAAAPMGPARGAAPAAHGPSTPFWRRLVHRDHPDEVVAALISYCEGELGCRRAFYVAVDRERGRLEVRFAPGFDPHQVASIPLSRRYNPLVAAGLAGVPVTLSAGFDAFLVGSGLGVDGGADPDPANPNGHSTQPSLLPPTGDGDAARGASYCVAIPLVGPPLRPGSGRLGGLEPRCALFERTTAPDMPPCYAREAPPGSPDIPRWAERVESMCPSCCAFGLTGVIVAERDEPFADSDLRALAAEGALVAERLLAFQALDQVENVATKLRTEREWLDTIMDATPDPIVVTDRANDLVFQNRRAAELLIPGESDPAGRRRAVELNDITFSAYLSSFAMDPKSAPRELPLIDPVEGSDFLFEAISRWATDHRGRPLGLVTLLRDITDLQRATLQLDEELIKGQRAERAVRAERDRLTLIIQSAVEPIVVTNPENEIVLANRGGERLFHEHAGDTGERQRALRHNDTYFSSFLTQLLADASVDTKREIPLLDPDSGQWRTFEVTSGKVRDPRGQTVAVVSVLHDMTELRELERRRVEQQLFESEKLAETGRLAAAIAHEMNNPLQSIKNALYIVGGRLETADRSAPLVAVASKECERVAKIVKQFLGFYRPDAQMSPVSVRQVLEDQLKLLAVQTRKHGIGVVQRLSRTPTVIGSEDQLTQVFLNLLLNAIQAMPQGGTLTIATRYEPGPTALSALAPAVRISVSDTGEGIDAEQQRRLFEPFTTSRKDGGSGLGLWVSYGIVKAHKGEIKVESAPRRGTTFHVVLPLGADMDDSRLGPRAVAH